MKNFTLIILCVMFMNAFIVEAVQTKPARFESFKLQSKKKTREEQKEIATKNIKSAFEKSLLSADKATAAVWRHGKEEAYTYAEGVWEFEGSYEKTYDKEGYVIYELYTDFEDCQYEYTYTYDENKQRASSYCEYLEEGLKFPQTKGEYKYDSKVTDFCISKLNFDHDGSGWVENYGNYKRTVERNTDGNVTCVLLSIPYMGVYEEIEKTDITYDEVTGKAKTYVLSRLYGKDADGNPVWNKELDLFDIEWENTDGQLVREWETFFMGNNRIKQASVYYDGEFDGYQKVTYTEGKVDFISDETDIAGNVYVRTQYTTLDTNGSYRIDSYEYEREGEEILDEYHMYDVVTYNEKGDILSVENFEEMEGEAVKIGGEKYTYVYDAETGVMLESLNEMYNMDEEVYEPVIKISYSNYTDVSSIEKVEVNENAPVEYYNLQGVKVANPENGIFIKKQGAKTTKVVL